MDIIRDAFEQITLPSVERLSITLDCYDSIYNSATSAPDGPEAPWGKFLLRSQPPVEYLELSISPSEWGIRAALRSLKPLCGLKSLRIGYGVAWSTGYEELVRGLREPFEGGLLCPELEKLEFEECVASDMEVILTLADHHSSMGRPNLKLIRAKFALPTEYYGESQEGFDVSATKDGVTLTRKANHGATVVLAWSRSQVDPHYRDSPSMGIPVFAGGYPSWP
ncbi:hypothetical protein PQX77_008964 [Marasmius sp. AFHP31]|nr:hypothetical protein PQX77_008964 [Marasmius sp. AFHP31]